MQECELIIMMYSLIALLLLCLLLPANSNQPLFGLTPLLPPTAFKGQTYACQFQVTGLSPVFSFKGLPKEFSWQGSGLIKGRPLNAGTYPITVLYATNSYKSSHQTLLRVEQPDDFPVNAPPAIAQYPVLSITASIDSYVFMAGTQVSMQFKATMGTPPYLWTYLRLPTELSGTLDGAVSGFFGEEGYFSFGVIVGDKEGKSADCFITLNIQPLTFFTQWTPQALRPISDVPVRDYFSILASQVVWKNYEAVSSQLTSATLNAANSQKVFKEAQKNLTKCNYILDLAKQYLQAAQQQLAVATAKCVQAQEFLNKTAFDLTEINKTLGVKKTAFALAQYSTSIAKKRMQDLQSICDKLAQLLKRMSADLSQAQNNLTAASLDLQDAQMNYNDSQDMFGFSISEKDIAKQRFHNITVLSQRLSGDVDEARGQVAVSKKAAALATDAFNSANRTAIEALQALKNANDNVTTLKREANAAKNDLGSAEMKLALTLNQLYVAYAAKEQADKAMAIVSAQSSLSISQNITFLGCSQGAYPSSFGSGQIAAVIQQGFLMTSGQRLLYGSCTIGGSCAVGDFLSFQGYLREGNIHLLSFWKLQFN